MPLDNPDIHEPNRTIGNAAKRVPLTFPSHEVVVVYHTPDGKQSSTHPFPNQRAFLFTVYAPGISPMAVIKVNHPPVDYGANHPALTEVLFFEFADDSHIATTDDDVRRHALIAAAQSDVAWLDLANPRAPKDAEPLPQHGLAHRLAWPPESPSHMQPCADALVASLITRSDIAGGQTDNTIIINRVELHDDPDNRTTQVRVRWARNRGTLPTWYAYRIPDTVTTIDGVADHVFHGMLNTHQGYGEGETYTSETT